jgi:hypothetical protein
MLLNVVPKDRRETWMVISRFGMPSLLEMGRIRHLRKFFA